MFFIGVKLTIKPIPEPPIPKLTIKTTQSDAIVTSNNCEISPLSSIQKLLIKPIQKECADTDVQSGSDENDSNENSIDASVKNIPIPKLTLKTSSVDRIAPSDTTPTVPKLILKMGGNKIICRDDVSQDTSINETAGENVHVTSEKISVEQTSTDLCDGNVLPNESDQIISLLEDSESNIESTENFDNSPSSDHVVVHSVTTKAILRDNPDSPRIILKINKSSTSEVKSVIESSSNASNTKDFNVENVVSSTMTLEPELLMECSLTNAKTMKRTQADLDSDVDFDDEPTKKTKVFDTDENATGITVEKNSPKSYTIISDEDTNDMKSSFEEQKEASDISDKNSEEKLMKPHTEIDCITIDDDSSSMEKQQVKDETATDINETANSSTVVEEIIDVTPVKRGRGRPKKILQTSTTKKLSKENDMDEKADETKMESSVDQKTDVKTPTRGRGRIRGRGGKTMEILKDGKVLQVKMDAGYEDDDSPTFSIYNRYATTRGRGRGGRAKRGMGRVRKSVSNEGAVNPFDPNKTPNSLVDSKVCFIHF